MNPTFITKLPSFGFAKERAFKNLLVFALLVCPSDCSYLAVGCCRFSSPLNFSAVSSGTLVRDVARGASDSLLDPTPARQEEAACRRDRVSRFLAALAGFPRPSEGRTTRLEWRALRSKCRQTEGARAEQCAKLFPAATSCGLIGSDVASKSRVFQRTAGLGGILDRNRQALAYRQRSLLDLVDAGGVVEVEEAVDFGMWEWRLRGSSASLWLIGPHPHGWGWRHYSRPDGRGLRNGWTYRGGWKDAPMV